MYKKGLGYVVLVSFSAITLNVLFQTIDVRAVKNLIAPHYVDWFEPKHKGLPFFGGCSNAKTDRERFFLVKELRRLEETRISYSQDWYFLFFFWSAYLVTVFFFFRKGDNYEK